VRRGVTLATVQHRAEDAGEATGDRVGESARVLERPLLDVRLMCPLLPPSDGHTAPHDAISAVFTGDTVLVFSEELMRGIWYACTAVGGGDCERLVIAPGRYEWRASQSSCERIVLRRGEWRVEGATLILEEASHVEIDGGTCATSDTRPRWSNGTAHDRTVEARSMERFALSGCSESERSQSEASCVRMREALR
jgi:hypothetical protein